MRLRLHLLALAGLLAFAAPRAEAELAEGDAAPDFEGVEFVNTEPCSFKSLRGHVVLVEIFRTWWGPCATQVVHLDKMQESYAAKGLKVLAITNEGRSLVDAFVAKTGAKHGIVIEAGDSADTFQIKGYPTSYLIGPDGKILAAGHPSEDQIVKALDLVRIPPELPKALAAVQAPLKKEKWAEARAKAQGLIDGGTLTSDDDKKAAEDLVKWIDWLAQGGLDTARQEGEKGRWYEAKLALEDVKKAFKGLPQAVEADTQLKALMADKAKKDEVTAFEKYLKAKQTQRDKDLKPKEALPLFKAIANKYENTRAGKAAAELVKQLEVEAGK